MSKAFLRKNLKLSLEFDTYAVRHPEIYDRIPNGAWLIMADASDKEFNKYSLAVARDPRVKEDILVQARKQGNRWQIKRLKPA